MTDTTTAGPVAGWYDDPAGAAPYRWWDGDRWTTRTLDHAPASPTAAVSLDSSPGEAVAPPPGSAAAGPAEPVSAPVEPVAARPDGSFPSRRSLRQATGEVPSVPAASAAVQEAQEHAPADFTPVNPLVPVHVAEPDEHSPAALPAPGAPDDGFHAPTAWVVNAPAAPAPGFDPGYGRGGANGYGRPTGHAPGAPLRVNPWRNRRANRALYLGIVGVGLLAVRLVVEHGTLYYFVPLSSAIGIVLAILGLRQSSAWVREGYLPRGRSKAIVALILCSIALVGQSIVSGLVFLDTHLPEPVQTPAAAAPAQPAQAPDAGTPQNDNGTTDYVYSEAIAEANIKQAIVSKTRLTPTSVTCPASEPLVIGTTFDCTVNLASGPLTAHMTVMSDQGELEISSVS
ncbi:DUF2510 domain-containing protein [Frondihabitans australicus]|uniref:Uncharacterized protein DUF2510 n=1 Tax=Frondihabitans australicus TaxID=386892 RepID=A0A495IDR6_9MICO|nr:DUF2510 domain-containing protein [Frondihabitans australicus]RKR73146.1 uncharacterized protein DUF2510 [Frondihabitans australicus]